MINYFCLHFSKILFLYFFLKKIISDRGEAGTFVFFLYPEALDFTNEDILTIDYHIEHLNSLARITLNEDAENLDCETLVREIKRCKIP